VGGSTIAGVGGRIRDRLGDTRGDRTRDGVNMVGLKGTLPF
jgi:hypothetical protein